MTLCYKKAVETAVYQNTQLDVLYKTTLCVHLLAADSLNKVSGSGCLCLSAGQDGS